MNAVIQDLRYALRLLAKHPAFTAVIIITLALGIGANAAIFSIMDFVLFRPLSFSDADRLVSVYEVNAEVSGFKIASPPNVEDWAQQSRTIEQFGLCRDWSFVYTAPDGAAGLDAGLATPGLFSVLGIKPLYGRLFTPEDMKPGNNHVLVLSHALWRDQLGGAADIIGRTVTLDGMPYVVVGVLPAGVSVPELETVQLWAPLHFDPREERRRSWRGFIAYGRLAADSTIEDARLEMNTIAQRLAQQYPTTNEGWGICVESLHERVVGPTRPALLAFMGAAGLVLLIGCVNVTNLLLTHANRRGREFAVRAALGADRFRLGRMLLTESLVLSLLGGTAGVLVAGWTISLIQQTAPAGIPRLNEATVDARVLGFTLLISALTSILSGLVPAVRSGGGALFQALKNDRSRVTFFSSRTGGGLITSEVAFATVLLIGACLLMRSFSTLTSWEPGFDREHVATVWLQVSRAKYSDGWQVSDLFRRAAEEIRTLPDVASTGLGSSGPLFGGREPSEFSILDRPAPPPDQPLVANTYEIDPGYLQTLCIPMLRGRSFTEDDVHNAPPVAIINQALASRYWPDQDPLGQQITLGRGVHSIIGVAADVVPLRPGEPAAPAIYHPVAQNPRYATHLVLRTHGDSTRIESALRARLRKLDPDMQIAGLRTMEQQVSRVASLPRFRMLLLGAFATVALLLAAIGIYGTVSYSMSQRTREMGVRIALGAHSRDILKTAIGKNMTPILIGVGVGLAGALALSQLIVKLLYGITPTDPQTFVGVALLMLGVALFATYIPARRASRINPITALRTE